MDPVDNPGDAWAQASAARVVFLLDCHTATERKILDASVSEHCPKGTRAYVVDMGTRRGEPSIRGMTRLKSLLDSPEGTYFVPMRVSWRSAQEHKQRRSSLRDLITGDAGSPGAFRQSLIHRRQPLPYRVVIAPGAELGELKRRLERETEVERVDHDNLARFVSKAAYLALDRVERSLTGGRHKIPRMIAEEVLGRPRLVAALKEISRDTGKPHEAVEQEARSCLKEMAAAHTGFGMDLAAALGRYMYTRAYGEQIELAAGDLERIRALMNEKPVAIGMTHKSHLDAFVLITMFHDRNLTPPHVFGGINMAFFGLGSLMKKAGTIFLRRSFQDNPVYKQVFKTYIDYLGEKRFPLLWALEGTRSRTGKLMPLRYGMINYVVSAYVRDNSPDLILVPTAVIYDQVPEVGDFDAMQAGVNKRSESASWFMQYIRGLKRPHGKIHVRFGKGVRVSDIVDLRQPDGGVSQRDIQKIAFELAVDVNSVTPITANSLISFVLLSHGHKARAMDELVLELTPLIEWIQLFDLPVTSDVAGWDSTVLDRSLRLLAAHKVVEINNDGMETVYAVPALSARKAAYYRNGMIHFVVTSAVADLALLSVTSTGEDAFAQFHREALHLRDLLKHEFFFEGREEFVHRLETELDLRSPHWRPAVARGAEAIRGLLSGMDVIFGHGGLRPFFEAYLLVAEALSLSAEGMSVDGKALLSRSHALGRQRLLQQRIHCGESVSGSYFENAIKIAESRGLLEGTQTAGDGRQQLLQELETVVAKTQLLASLAESKRLATRSLARSAPHVGKAGFTGAGLATH